MGRKSREKGKRGEAWRAAPGWEGHYEVSSLGSVRGVRRRGSHGRELFQSIDSKGYPQVTLYRLGLRTSVKVHRLVAGAFLGQRAAGEQVNHIDGEKRNNSAPNLEYVSAAENTHHAIRIGLNDVGSSAERCRAIGRAKARFSSEQIRDMRRRVASGESRHAIAIAHGLHVMTVGEIVRREIYTWVS